MAKAFIIPEEIEQRLANAEARIAELERARTPAQQPAYQLGQIVRIKSGMHINVAWPENATAKLRGFDGIGGPWLVEALVPTMDGNAGEYPIGWRWYIPTSAILGLAEPEPAVEPAPKYKAGDRVVRVKIRYDKFGSEVGTKATIINSCFGGSDWIVETDDGKEEVWGEAFFEPYALDQPTCPIPELREYLHAEHRKYESACVFNVEAWQALVHGDDFTELTPEFCFGILSDRQEFSSKFAAELTRLYTEEWE